MPVACFFAEHPSILGGRHVARIDEGAGRDMIERCHANKIVKPLDGFHGRVTDWENFLEAHET